MVRAHMASVALQGRPTRRDYRRQPHVSSHRHKDAANHQDEPRGSACVWRGYTLLLLLQANSGLCIIRPTFKRIQSRSSYVVSWSHSPSCASRVARHSFTLIATPHRKADTCGCQVLSVVPACHRTSGMICKRIAERVALLERQSA